MVTSKLSNPVFDNCRNVIADRNEIAYKVLARLGAYLACVPIDLSRVQLDLPDYGRRNCIIARPAQQGEWNQVPGATIQNVGRGPGIENTPDLLRRCDALFPRGFRQASMVG